MRKLYILFFILMAATAVFGTDKIYPDKPNPPVLVNDFANMLNASQKAQLEQKLDGFAQSTSTQITVVTITNLGGHDVEEYSVELFNQWGLGQAGKNNGVLLLVSMEDHKGWITVGKGLEGVLTDLQSGQIWRNELVPAFKQKRYFDGLNDASDAIIAVTKGEYKAEGLPKNKHFPVVGIFIIILIIFFIIKLISRGGGGGGNYMSGGGAGNFIAGMFLGEVLGGGRGSGWGGGGDSGFGGGGGGFGGFGGGSTGGGGAGGSW